MDLESQKFLYNYDAQSREIKSIEIYTRYVLSILMLERDYYVEATKYLSGLKFESGYYVIVKNDDKFISSQRFETLFEASSAFNTIYQMYKTN